MMMTAVFTVISMGEKAVQTGKGAAPISAPQINRQGAQKMKGAQTLRKAQSFRLSTVSTILTQNLLESTKSDQSSKSIE